MTETRFTATCEGCGTTQAVTTSDRRRVNPPLPAGWVGCGRSDQRNVRGKLTVAMWCWTCQLDGTAARRLGISQLNFTTK